MEKQKIIAVVGPTASGKTALAVEIAKKYNGEVISADSMQIYKGFSIASAKPTEDEMQGITHHLIDCKSIDEKYSVAQFVQEANQICSDIVSRGKLPVLCGGTGLYIDSFVNGITFIEEGYDEAVRLSLRKRLENEGIDSLFKELEEIDPDYAKKLDRGNAKRIIRALEIYYSSGIKMSEQIIASKSEDSPYDCLYIGIKYLDRQKLYDRINKRVDIMLERGLVDEARQFYDNCKVQTASQAIGIKELKAYLDGNETLESAVERIKQQTRRYAKRQLTWFNRNKNVNWLYPDEDKDIYSSAFKLIDSFLKGRETA